MPANILNFVKLANIVRSHLTPLNELLYFIYVKKVTLFFNQEIICKSPLFPY